MLASVRQQTFVCWEHCIVDDGSRDPAVAVVLAEAAATDERVVVTGRSASGGIAAATNAALALARGTFVAFLDHDDLLRPDALSRVAAAITDAGDDVDYAYTDEDKVDLRGRHREPFLKPGFSLERLRCQMYTAHLSVARRELVEQVGGLRAEYDGAQDWDLVLRIAERARRVVHVPGLAHSWRVLPTSTASGAGAKPWAHGAAKRAIEAHVSRTALPAVVEPMAGYPGTFHVRPASGAFADGPLVSIVIPTGGGRRAVGGRDVVLVEHCVRTLVHRTTFRHYELVVVVDDHVEAEIGARLAELGGDRVRLVAFDRPFNFSEKVMAGAAEASGEQLLLLNDDIEVRMPGWIEAMLLHASQPGVGAVGARLLYPDGRLQHAGIIAVGGYPTHAWHGAPGDTAGYFGNAVVPGSFLGVTAACMLTPRDAFDAVGGFDPALPLNYNDVDYCLKLGAAGLRSVFAPDAVLVHHESATRTPQPATAAEMAWLRERWACELDADPSYQGFLPWSAWYQTPRFRADGTFGTDLGTVRRKALAAADALRVGGPRLLWQRVQARRAAR